MPVKDGTMTIRVNKKVKSEASKRAAEAGMDLSEYIRLQIANLAKYGTESYLDSPEAKKAKRDVENGKTELIGTLHDFDKWMDKL